MEIVVNGEKISLSDITKASSVKLSDSDEFQSRVNKAHDFLVSEIKDGKPIYGVTTGYGESGKNYLLFEESKILQTNLFRFHGCGVGKNLDEDEAFYMTLIRMISLSKGYSGISFNLLKRLELLINERILPVVPEQGSVGASGDLTPLSYLAATIAGEREVYYRGEIRKTIDVYSELGIEPYELQPKEALAIMNGTATMSAIATNSIKKFENFLHAYSSFIAGIFELLQADDTPLQPLVHEVKPFEGQIAIAKEILAKLEGTKLTHSREERYNDFFNNETLNIQDRYSIRCTPQVLGVVLDNITVSKNWIETEINAVNDNPVIDGENRKIYTTGNFYGGYIAHAMDTLRISAANVADLLDKQFAILVDHKYNRGLGENLKLSDKNYFHGFKAMQITLSSLSADVMMNITPASVFSRPTESMNQDKVSMGTTAAIHFKNQLPNLENMLAIAMMGLAQAVDIREKKGISPHLEKVYNAIREEVAPLVEDRRMDFDIGKIKALINSGRLA
ncbi:aromatic amino acid lyase [Sulfurovum sp. bin170]|uniref:HAL/PAL/TAL family ammonia-lyase n=1 Tax=Sulfurovum sp. bin170 TaxID=2695268 RepID=UPI0013DF218B|nr:aromatic amino acid ammonia-lyase [Sulfurovum sp. bin170]NEW61532.1 aromatic amino acid lyase [Sulfurovum sp. bin170]